MTEGHSVILVIVGDPSLDPTHLRSAHRIDGAAAEQTVRDYLLDAVSALPPRSMVITPGRPHGPERWAVEIAQSIRRAHGHVAGAGLELVEFHADGARTSLRGDPITKWGEVDRNREIVQRAKAAQGKRWDVRFLVFRRHADKAFDPIGDIVSRYARDEGMRVEERVIEG